MIRPLGDRVVLKVKEVSNQTVSGIIIPKADTSSGEATVVAVGPGRYTEKGENLPLEVSVGEQVIFSKFAGTPVQFEGENLLIVHEGDIIAVV